MSEWKKPGRCESAHCVEVNDAGSFVLLRSSESPLLMAELTKAEFSVFVQAVKDGEYDEYV